MSELTRCNRCKLNDMQRKAAERGISVIVKHIDDPLDNMHGWIAVSYSDQPECRSWFMALSDDCAC